MSIDTANAAELTNLIAQGHTVIDVRTPSEYRAEHVTGAELVPLDTLNPADFCLQCEPGFPVYIICQGGKRAQIAAEKLAAAGHQNLYVIEGGTNAAKAAGVDIEYGQGAISIERQVRIAAGFLVLIGTLAGAFIHLGFLFVSGFVGCGLIFAGITDTCGMAMMLTKMPWNR